MNVNAVSYYFYTRARTVGDSSWNPGLTVCESGHGIKEMDRMAGSQRESIHCRIVVRIGVGQGDINEITDFGNIFPVIRVALRRETYELDQSSRCILEPAGDSGVTRDYIIGILSSFF